MNLICVLYESFKINLFYRIFVVCTLLINCDDHVTLEHEML